MRPSSPDVVLPISRRSPTQSSWFIGDSATWLTLPPDVYTIEAEILASGNAQEEFWAMNAAEAIGRDRELPALGCGPYREVQLLIDATLAAVVAPWRASAPSRLG